MAQPSLTKFKYRIISCTSEESDFPVRDLANQSYQNKGWQSSRFCEYPQELTIEFMAPIRLQQVQFLSHQYKIASKIQIYTYFSEPNQQQQQNSEIKYKKLGHFSLDPNDKTGFKARELKSVYIDSQCILMKLLFFKHHINKHNVFNQIGLISLNCFGDYLNYNQTGLKNQQNQRIEHLPNEVLSVDSEIQFDAFALEQLKALHVAKDRAVQQEHYEEAKQLKDVIERIKSIVLQLKQLEEKKMIAIQNEDYDTAKIIKFETDRLRNASASGHIIQKSIQYLQHDQQIQKQISSSHYQETKQNIQQQEFNIQQSDQEYQDDRPIIPMSQNNQIENYNSSQISQSEDLKQSKHIQKSNIHNHDEQIIPALVKHMEKNSQILDEQPQNDPDYLEAESFTQISKKLADPFIQLLGEQLCKKIFSKKWQIRELGLVELEEEIIKPQRIQRINTTDYNNIFAAIIGICTHTISDKIIQIQIQSMKLLQTLCITINPSTKSTDMQKQIDNILGKVFEKIGESNQRVQKLAEESLFSMGQCQIIGISHIVSAITTGSILDKKYKFSHRHLAARLLVLQQFVKRFKIDNQDVPLQSTLDFAINNISTQSRDVRKQAIYLISIINQVIGEKKLRPCNLHNNNQLVLEGIPLQQMEIINDVLNGKSIDDAIKGKEPKKYHIKQPKEKESPKPKKENLQDSKVHKKKGEVIKACEFCGKQDKEFSDSNKMDIHLWKECPMLTTCLNCAQVVEISAYGNHLLEVCDQKKMFKKCGRCKEAIPVTKFKHHLEELVCIIAKPMTIANRCPLCHLDIQPTMNGWKKHLIDDGCPNNERQL